MPRTACRICSLAMVALLSLPHLSFSQELDRLVRAELNSLTEFYKDLHANPELSYFEKNTSAKIAARLRSAGFEVTYPVGKYPGGKYTCYGVVAVMKNGEGPTVMVRADMDALPIEEKTGLEWASRVRMKDISGEEVGVMHACGHDMHSTTLVGTARLLSQLKSRWSGTLIMIGQTAEERGGGARRW